MMAPTRVSCFRARRRSAPGRFPGRRAALACALALSLAPAAGRAEDRQAAGEALFEEALRSAEQGDHQAACEKFRRSYARSPATGTLFNVGACEARLGRLASALAAFEALEARLPADHPRMPEIRGRVAELRARAPRLVVRLAEETPPAARLTLDGRPLPPSRLGEEIRLDPGRHAVEASAGRASRSYEIELGPGASRVIEVSLPRDAAAPDEGPGAARIAGFSALGLGALGLTVGSVAGVLVLDRKATVDDLCPGEERACGSAEGVAASDAGRTLSGVSTVGFAFGLAGLGAGAWLLLASPGPSSSPRAALRVSTGLGGASLVARGSF